MQTSTERIRLPKQVTVVLGAHDLENSAEVGRYNAGVKKITLHDDYNPATDDYDGDIAIITLAQKISFFNNFIRPVCLPTIEDVDLNLGEVAGWGITDDSEMPSNIPKKKQKFQL